MMLFSHGERKEGRSGQSAILSTEEVASDGIKVAAERYCVLEQTMYEHMNTLLGSNRSLNLELNESDKYRRLSILRTRIVMNGALTGMGDRTTFSHATNDRGLVINTYGDGGRSYRFLDQVTRIAMLTGGDGALRYLNNPDALKGISELEKVCEKLGSICL